MTLIGRWTFAGLGGPWDETEQWQTVELQGAAKLTHRGLELKKGDWARVRPTSEKKFTIKEKTLIAWLILNDLADKRPAGSVLTLDTINEDKFDGIVFGETADATWMAGSTNGLRWAEKPEPSLAETKTGDLIQMAITYTDDGAGNAKIAVYRNGDLKQSYTKGKLATWTNTNDIEVIFGARHTYLQDANALGYVNATIVAAEIHDECLSADAFKLRQHTDPSTFVRRTISLQPRNGAGGGSVTAIYPGTLRNQLVQKIGDLKENLTATWKLVPGLADPTLVSMQGNYSTREYIVASADGTIGMQRPNGTNAFRKAATFRKLPGLAGQGWSLESLAYPGRYLRENRDGYIDLAPSDASDWFKTYASFLEKEVLIPDIDITTELPLDDESWYIISNHYATPASVLGLRSDGVVDLVALPESGAIDHLLWRLDPLPVVWGAPAGLHRWRLVNKKDGAYLYVDLATKNLGTRKDATSSFDDNTWTIRPIPWMGSDYFAITSDKIGQTLGCDIDLSHGGVQSAPRMEPLNLVKPKQRWRFTFMSYVERVERPASPDRISSLWGTNLDFGKVDVRWQPVAHDEYVKTYPQYAGALGMDYVATASVSDWALAMARTVLTNVLLTLKDRTQIAKFKNYRILIVSDGDGDEADMYPDIGNPEFTGLVPGQPSYRGFTDNRIARISEEMMCRTGVTHTPNDTDYRKYDQAVHEFGHTIDKLLSLSGALRQAQGTNYDVENFPWWVQSWFDCAMIWGKGGTREGFSTARPDSTRFIQTLFRTNPEWRPYEVKYKHGNPEKAVLSAVDKAAPPIKAYDSGSK